MLKHTSTLPADLIRFLSGLVLTGGDHDGELFEVLPWQRKLIRGAFAKPGPVSFTAGRG